MASSGYYYNLYKQNRDAVKKYEGDIKDLKKIRDNLTDSLGDEIRAINKELEDLKADLKKAVRHNSKFTSCANEITVNKEKATTADTYLSVTYSEIEEEISVLEGKKNQAIQDRDYYYDKYKQKKDEEQKEFWESIF